MYNTKNKDLDKLMSGGKNRITVVSTWEPIFPSYKKDIYVDVHKITIQFAP